MSSWGDEEASLEKGDGAVDSFMKLITMGRCWGPIQRESQSLIGLFGRYTVTGSRMQSYISKHADRLVPPLTTSEMR